MSKLGPCCMCGGDDDVINIVMLPLRGLVPGKGWGCLQCGLPLDGAVAVICEGCMPRYQTDPAALTMCCHGFAKEGRRVPIAELPGGVFDHDMSKHPEETD